MSKTSKTTRTARKSSTSSKINVDRALVQTVQERVITLLDRRNGQWTGTMTALGTAITTGIRRAAPSNWPQSPSFLRRVLNVAVPSIRKAGVSVKFGRTTDHSRTRFVSLVRG